MTKDRYIEFENKFYFRRNMTWYENDLGSVVRDRDLIEDLNWELWKDGYDDKLEKYVNEIDYEFRKRIGEDTGWFNDD